MNEIMETVPENAGSGITAFADLFQGNTAYFQISLFLLLAVFILVIACLKSISRYKKEIAALKLSRGAKYEEERAREIKAGMQEIKTDIWSLKDRINKSIQEIKAGSAKGSITVQIKDGMPYFLNEGNIFNFYIGVNAGGKMMGAIRNAQKSIKIISPYISAREIERLCEKQNSGLTDITVITSASDDNLKKFWQVKALKALISRTEKKGGGYAYAEKIKSVFFKADFFHAKLYIIDETAFAGSVNFTKKGTEKSHETSLTIRDPDVVKGLREYYDGIFSANLFKWNVAELGEKIYNFQRRKKTDEKTVTSGGAS
jgi:phosphatidylserine/phosphatidylglycerophosphate/cardiolipin synthase-like enzyme